MPQLLYDFTKQKFLALTLKQQHKKCAELLYRLYNQLLNKQEEKEQENDQECYQKLLEWMEESSCNIRSLKAIADRYHWHLKRAQIFKKEHRLLPSIRQGDQSQGEEPWPIAIYLDHLRSAHNVGSIIRTVEAFSLGKIYFSPETPFIHHQQVQNTAMGAAQWVNCFQGIDLASLPRPIVALETSEEALSLYEFIFPPSFTLVMGNEEYGCSDAALRLADCLVEVPLRGHKNSLNVANAFAIAAGEISRQKIVF